MTCREFIETAESLTPLQLHLLESKNQTLSAHARECAGCGKWLESQRLLGSALQLLRSQTAQREASPKVEVALMKAFRRQDFEPAEDVAPDRAAPAAWKLSRFFEVGAYLAVAAALIVGMFLGGRMWRDRQASPARVQVQEMSAPQPVNPQPAIVPDHDHWSVPVPTEVAQQPAHSAGTRGAISSTQRPQNARGQAVATTVDRQGFVALMFCDPLICAGDEQVIRMELPGNASASADGNGSQPVIADVVVGDDGLVRAMRIVSQ